MQHQSTSLPPQVISATDAVYVVLGDVYSLEKNSGQIQHRFPLKGSAEATIVDDRLYLNVSNHPDYDVRCLRVPDGTALWSYPLQERLAGAPAVANGIVYVSTVEGTIHALQASDGTLLWQQTFTVDAGTPPFQRPSLSTPPAVTSTILCVAPVVNQPSLPFVYAFAASSGALLWKAQIPESSSTPLTIYHDRVYASTNSMCLALRVSDGSFCWQRTREGVLLSSPVVTDEALYVSGFRRLRDPSTDDQRLVRQAYLYALRTLDGSVLWERHLGTGTASRPLVTHESLFIATDDGTLLALQCSDGSVRWRYKTAGTQLSSPVVSQDVIYVGANDGSVSALRMESGSLVWNTSLQGNIIVQASLALDVSTTESAEKPLLDADKENNAE